MTDAEIDLLIANGAKLGLLIGSLEADLVARAPMFYGFASTIARDRMRALFSMDPENLRAYAETLIGVRAFLDVLAILSAPDRLGRPKTLN